MINEIFNANLQSVFCCFWYRSLNITIFGCSLRVKYSSDGWQNRIVILFVLTQAWADDHRFGISSRISWCVHHSRILIYYDFRICYDFSASFKSIAYWKFNEIFSQFISNERVSNATYSFNQQLYPARMTNLPTFHECVCVFWQVDTSLADLYIYTLLNPSQELKFCI